MKKVILRGPSLTQSGYGVHCRQIASWLLTKEIDLKFQALPWGDTPWILNPDSHAGLIEKIIKNTVDSLTEKFDVSFQLQLPNEWDSNLAKFNVGLTAAVETDICNRQWIDACNKMDMVIVPSTHAANSLKQTGDVSKPLLVVPEAFCEEILLENDVQNAVKDLPVFSTDFNFLVFGQVTGDNPQNDRKNIFFTIKWICESFKDNKDVGIVLKTNLGRNTQIDKKRTEQLVQALAKECRRGPFPKIHLLHGAMSDLEVSALYKHPQIKALVSLTRGEGYGLPILEAAASGLPVIATGWSGHLDFLNHGKYVDIAYNLKQIHPTRVDEKIFVRNAKWAEVIEDDFKKKIVKFKNASSLPKEWATSLAETIKSKYSLKEVCKKYDEALKDIL